MEVVGELGVVEVGEVKMVIVIRGLVGVLEMVGVVMMVD